MINELNEFLTAYVAPEKRAVLLNTARILESIIGENTYVAIDEITQAPDSHADPIPAVDQIYQVLLALTEVVYNKFGIYLDEDQVTTQDLQNLTDALEALVGLELQEERDYLCNLIDTSDTASEALLNVLEEVAPGSSLALEAVLDRVDPNLIYALKDRLREPNPYVELEAQDDTTEARQRQYVERCQAFRRIHGRPPLVGSLLEHGAKLQYDPFTTVSLISAQLETNDFVGTAKELYALAVYSSIETSEIHATVQRLIEHVCTDPEHVTRVVSEFLTLFGARE